MVSIFCRRVRKARQYPRVIYIPRELTSRSSTNLDRHCATPDEATRGFIGTAFIRTIFFEFWRKRKKRRRRKKWKRKFESTIGGLTPAHGGGFENGLWRDSLCSSKVIRGMQVCVVGYLPYMQETEKGERWTRAFFLEAARSKYSSNRSLLPV